MILDNTFTEVTKDLQIIEDLFCKEEEDYEKLYRQLDLTEDEFLQIKTGRLVPDKIQLENIYNFAYSHNLFLNEISWFEAEDEFTGGNITIQSHGAHVPIIGDIILEKAPGSSNDFGDGFYLGEDISQAGMWVANDVNSSLYIFTFDRNDLMETRFNVDVDWMLAVALCRHKLDDYLEHPRIKLLKEAVDSCDYVYAPIADNNLFDIIDDFINGNITDLQCLYALSATHLGYQVVLKNEKALSHIDLKKHLYLGSVEKSLFNRQSDIESNVAMHKSEIANRRYEDVGKYINELLDEKDGPLLTEGLLIEKRIELNDKMYIDSWYDKFSRSYITQVKDNEDNELDYAYSGDAKGRDHDIQAFKDLYKEEIVEYLQPKEDKKKKKKELPITGLNPEVIPDPGKGIETFNHNMDVGEVSGEAPAGGGE